VTGVGGASPGPAPTPVEVRGRGPSGWVALGLFAAALVALVGLSIVGQSGGASIGPVPTCPPGSNPDQPGPVDQARPPRDSLVAMAFDRRAGKLVGFVGYDAHVETWTFDVCTNVWAQMHPKHQPSGRDTDDFRDRIVYDVDSDVTIASDGVWMWAYDLAANTWTEKGRTDLAEPHHLIYDPRSGLVVAASGYGGTALWTYEVETDTWATVHQVDGPAVEAQPRDLDDLVYDTSVDLLVAYDVDEGAGPETRLFDLSAGTWSETGAVAPEFSYPGWRMWPAMEYDEAAERTVLLGQGHTSAYDAAADRWETLYETPSKIRQGPCGTRPECRSALQVVYDAVNQRLVVYDGVAPTGDETSWVSMGDVLAFDTRTREWTVLLEPGTGRATP
jgi:hypothetical protein